MLNMNRGYAKQIFDIECENTMAVSIANWYLIRLSIYLSRMEIVGVVKTSVTTDPSGNMVFYYWQVLNTMQKSAFQGAKLHD